MISFVWQREELVVERNDLNYVDSSDSKELLPFCASRRDMVRVTYKGTGSLLLHFYVLCSNDYLFPWP